MTDLKGLIRTIPDYPKRGIMFRDITTLLADEAGFREVIRRFAERYAGQRIAKVAGIEARGFILGGALADRLGTGFVPIRKKGKLPWETIGHDYDLEYGTDRVEVHRDAVAAGERVVLVDDLIATGGTARAGLALLRRLGATVVEACFVIDLPDLGGRKRLEAEHCSVLTLVEFEGE
jgi:adenine phosphoribosyltransferase